MGCVGNKWLLETLFKGRLEEAIVTQSVISALDRQRQEDYLEFPAKPHSEFQANLCQQQTIAKYKGYRAQEKIAKKALYCEDECLMYYDGVLASNSRCKVPEIVIRVIRFWLNQSNRILAQTTSEVGEGEFGQIWRVVRYQG